MNFVIKLFLSLISGCFGTLALTLANASDLTDGAKNLLVIYPPGIDAINATLQTGVPVLEAGPYANTAYAPPLSAGERRRVSQAGALLLLDTGRLVGCGSRTITPAAAVGDRPSER